MDFSKGRHLPDGIEVMIDGKTKIMTPEELKRAKSERVKAKHQKKPKEKEPVDEVVTDKKGSDEN